VRAAVYLGAGRLELQDRPEPRVGPGELLLRLRGCGLGGSDIAKVAHDTATPPAVLGHEVVGDVVAVAPGGARGFQRGGEGPHHPSPSPRPPRRGRHPHAPAGMVKVYVRP
jgi:L-iditol 2-dehydrogenase